MLPLFFNYYDAFVDRYYIHDNGSDDGSLEILEAHPRVTVLPLVLEGDSLCESAFQQVNNFWKPSIGAADWVAVCNVDELFWHPDLPWYLEQCRKRDITWIPTTGWEMMTEDFPAPETHLPTACRRGVRFPHMDKPSFFNPNSITDSGFAMARHSAEPKGQVILPKQCEVQLLHYKHLGFEYTSTRQAELQARMREKDREKKWGFQYDAELVVKRFEELRSEGTTVAAPSRGSGHRRAEKWRPRAPKPRRIA